MLLKISTRIPYNMDNNTRTDLVDKNYRGCMVLSNPEKFSDKFGSISEILLD